MTIEYLTVTANKTFIEITEKLRFNSKITKFVRMNHNGLNFIGISFRPSPIDKDYVMPQTFSKIVEKDESINITITTTEIKLELEKNILKSGQLSNEDIMKDLNQPVEKNKKKVKSISNCNLLFNLAKMVTGIESEREQSSASNNQPITIEQLAKQFELMNVKMNSMAADHEKMKKDNKAEIDQMKKDHKAEIDQMKKDHKAEIDQMKNEIDELKKELNEVKRIVNPLIARYKMEKLVYYLSQNSSELNWPSKTIDNKKIPIYTECYNHIKTSCFNNNIGSKLKTLMKKDFKYNDSRSIPIFNKLPDLYKLLSGEAHPPTLNISLKIDFDQLFLDDDQKIALKAIEDYADEVII
jgi:hypothetical protein